MSLQWLLFANLSVAGMLVYNICFKMSGDQVSAFGFTFILGCVQMVTLALCFLVARYGLKMDVIGNPSPRTMGLAAIAGVAVVMVDIALLLAYRHASAVTTNTYSSIAEIVLFALVAAILFRESMTVVKGIGILFGVISLVLVAI